MADYRDQNRIGVVAAIGAGVIGNGWAAAYLGSGRSVRLYDPAPGSDQRTRAHVAEAWPQMAELGLASAGDEWTDRLTVHAELADVIASADFIQESTPEEPELKAALFADLDRLVAPDVVIASSTSSLPITALQSGLVGAERFVLGHPFNPVHLIPLVEVGGGDATAREAIDVALALYQSMGKAPVRLRREIFGHIGNRLTSAMFREAVRLVEEGYATVADVDRAIQYGPALKWAIQGQFRTFHTSGGPGGLADFLDKYAGGIIRRWSTMTDPPLADAGLQALLVAQMQEASEGSSVADIAAYQDDRLMELLKLLEPDRRRQRPPA